MEVYMKTLTNNEVECVSGGNYSLYGGGYYNSSYDYGASLGAGYTFNLGNSYLTTSVSGFNFSSGGNFYTPTIGLTWSW